MSIAWGKKTFIFIQLTFGNIEFGCAFNAMKVIQLVVHILPQTELVASRTHHQYLHQSIDMVCLQNMYVALLTKPHSNSNTLVKWLMCKKFSILAV